MFVAIKLSADTLPVPSRVRRRDKSAGAPRELQAVAQWVLWRWEIHDGQRTKVPCDARTGRRADVRDPAAWSSYGAARRALKKSGERFAGVGFVFTPLDPFCGVDLDNAVDEHSGELLPWARSIVERLATYTELSPSGRGVKLFLRGHLPAGGDPAPRGGRPRHSRRGFGEDGLGSVEVYDERRFFTVTGRRVGEPPVVSVVADRHAELEAWYRELFPEPARRLTAARTAVVLEDDVVLQRAMRAANGSKFARLWAGDASAYAGDESARDAALCACLAFYTRDPRQIERLVSRSGCARAKWEERPDYRERTIRFALERA